MSAIFSIGREHEIAAEAAPKDSRGCGCRLWEPTLSAIFSIGRKQEIAAETAPTGLWEPTLSAIFSGDRRHPH